MVIDEPKPLLPRRYTIRVQMTHEIPPVRRHDWQQEDSTIAERSKSLETGTVSSDSEATVIGTVRDDTQHHRGMGRSGRRIEHTDRECPHCSHDQTIQYWCLNPLCRYFVSDELSWATKPHPQYVPETPEVWQQTCVCPQCDSRHTKLFNKAMRDRCRFEDGIAQEVCEACENEALEQKN